MKNKYFAFVALATAVLTTACAGDETATEQKQNTDETKTVTLTASVKEGQTRVGMTKNNDTSASFYWHSTDEILVQMKSGDTYNGQPFSITKLGEDATSADFTGTVTGTMGTYAVYPYSASHKFSSATELTYNLPVSYTYEKVESYIFGNSTAINMPMLGTISSDDESKSVSFRCLGGLAVIRVASMPATSGTLTITADQQLCGNFSVSDLSATTPEITTPTTTAAANNAVTFEFKGATSGEVGVFYLPLATGSYTNVKVAIAYGDNKTLTYDYGSLTVKRAEVTAINFALVDYDNAALGDVLLKSGELVRPNNGSITSDQQTNAIGIVAYLYGTTNACTSQAGTHGLVLSLTDEIKNTTGNACKWRTVNSQFGTLRTTLKAAYEEGENGLVLTTNVMKVSGYASAFPVFGKVADYRSAYPAPTAYTTDWYLPSIGEWIDIISTDGIGGMDVSSMKGANSYTIAKAWGTGNSVIDNFDEKLKVVGTGNYKPTARSVNWASTEYSESQAYDIFFDANNSKMELNVITKTNAYASSRCILAF